MSHLSCSCSYAPGSVHDPGDGGQSLLTAPQRLLSAQVGGNGRADHVGRTADEEAGRGQDDGVDELVVWGSCGTGGGRGRQKRTLELRSCSSDHS